MIGTGALDHFTIHECEAQLDYRLPETDLKWTKSYCECREVQQCSLPMTPA